MIQFIETIWTIILIGVLATVFGWHQKVEIMNKLLEQLEAKIRLAKYYRGICNNEITEDYIKEAQQIFKQIIGELKQ